jgi:FixJ family two-component response regulator
VWQVSPMSPTVLIADDDRVARAILASWLQAAGFECWQTVPHRAAAEARARRPKATIVGVHVTRDAAIALARSLSENPEPTSVVVLSRPDLAFALAATEAGAFDCLPWPTSEQGLVESVTRAVDASADASRAHLRARDDDHARQMELATALRTVRALAAAHGRDGLSTANLADLGRPRCS